MEKLSTRITLAVRKWKIPRDGIRRYLYDVWQPLALLVLMVCFTGSFFAAYDLIYDPYGFGEIYYEFFCNADDNPEEPDVSYRPF